MGSLRLPPADRYGIIEALPDELSEPNRQRIKKFGAFMFLYDFAQDHFVRPRLHRADPRRHGDILRNEIAAVKSSAVLDIGCGTGAAIPYFDGSNSYTGLDLSYSMLRQAVKRAKKKSFAELRLIQGNAEKLIFEDGIFDFVLMDTTLHMIPDYKRAVAEVRRVMSGDGAFLCSTPAVGLDSRFDDKWAKIAGKRVLHSLSEDDIIAVCSGNGMTYERIATNGGVLYFRAGSRE